MLFFLHSHRGYVVFLRLATVKLAILGKLIEQFAERSLIGTCLAPLLIGIAGGLAVFHWMPIMQEPSTFL